MATEYFYFAKDGSYGLWEEGSVLAPSDWLTKKDWQDIEECSDSERADLARAICIKREKAMKGVI